MDAKSIKKYVIIAAVIAMVFMLSISVAAEKCSEKQVLKLEMVLTDLDCSEQDRAVLRELFHSKVSECDIAMIKGVCRPNSSEEGLTEENSLRLELNNTTVKEASY